MKKVILIITAVIFALNAFSAPLFENFDTFTNSGYGNYTHNGWTITNGLSENQASRLYLGTGRTVRLRNNSGSALQSPAKTGGIGTIDFWYGNWDGSPAISKVYIETSSNGTTWTKVDSIENITSVPYLNYTKVINDAFGQYVRVINSGEERLFIDNFNITDNTAGCTGFYIDSIATTICSFDSVEFRGSFYSTAGIVRDTVLSTCDTIFILNLMTRTGTVYDLFDTICSLNDSILFKGSYLKTAGTFYDTIQRIGDCDSIIKLNLSLKFCPIACEELFISEYIEGSGNNKALEFYNPTTATIDLSLYEIVVFRNTNDTIALSGMLASGDVHVITNSNAALANIISNSDATASIFFNGDDRIELLKANVVIDRFGAVGVTGNFAQNETYQRVNTVQNGNLSFDLAEWVVLPVDTDSLIGSHTSICNCTIDIDTIKDTICSGTTVMLGSQNLSMTGTYSDTLVNASGCDSITTLELVVTAVLRDTMQDTICSGSSIMLGTQVLTMTGTYSDTTQNAAGCDSISTIELVVTAVLRDTMQDTICQGSSVLYGTQTLTMSGNYSDTAQTAAGCDSISTLELVVTAVLRDTMQDTICSGSSVMLGTQVLTMAGTYSDTTQNAAGCDSISTIELVVTAVLRDTMQDTICQGSSVLFGTQTLTMSGNYSDTTQNAAGCDSISTLELVVTAVLRDTMQDTICSGSSVMLGTQVLTITGSYSDTTQNASGCDSINTIELVVNTAPRDTMADTICQGSSVLFGTQTLTMSGNYSDTAQTAAGCDSITVMELLVNDYIRDTIADTICANAPFMLGTQLLSITGTYSDTAQNAAGCDSITTLELVVDAISRDTIVTTICSGASVMLGSNSYNATGFYSDTLQNAAGCDSISVLNLTVISYPVTMVSATACDTFTTVGGQMVNISGTFIDTLTASTGCDSIVSTAVIINYTTYAIDSATACGSYISPSGLLWTTSGTRFDTVQTAKGCDSIITFTLTIKANTAVTRNVSSCFSYTTPETGNVYRVSGTYQDTAVNAFGCSFFITTNLTINVANAGTVSVSGITLTANQTGVTYKWADCDNNFSYVLGETNNTFTPVRNGNYAVIVTTPEGCSDTSACTSINSVSLEEFEITSNNISIYPNPATDFVTVDILSQNESEEVTISLFDAIGKLVYTKEVNAENNKVVIDLEGLENGLYTVSVSNEFFITTKKISVVK